MADNRMAQMISAGKCPVQAAIGSGSPFVTKLISSLGFDSLLLDLQHGAFGIDRLYDMTLPLSPESLPMVRVPSYDPGLIEKVIDMGVQGIICPDVRTPAQAEGLVEACRWSRHGAVFTVAQIESVEGLENIDEIAATPGLNALFPGPVDLARAFGGNPKGLEYDDAPAAERLLRIIDAGHSAGLAVTLPASNGAQTRQVLEWGVDWLIVGPDHAWMAMAARQALADTRGLIRERPRVMPGAATRIPPLS
jgi:4-hydroxy-2-oxoheptanedioate aldolase